ncbi:peptidoglycan-binding domain-containing protein [Actinomadura sp. DC4]|uniref:peptidoglycan-binding domain-containing protein n=1 Tax=Actinomadura sp. DC4 TaxID=3055069 RepID=UPI0025B21C11|nr:peptidoglycan-binding domain-containing protein [Actinomadura sp. DC4]MDN3353071.1 peptidoglycan-binding domain-containing protein [Actinomadura sp. DC4]
MKRLWIFLTAVGGLAAIAAGALWTAGSGPSATASSTPSAGTTTATVTRTDLVETDQEQGTLGFAGARTLQSSAAGILTAESAEGATVTRDQALYGVGLHPVRLFYGTVPLSRTLALGVSAGKDVKQLERNLRTLGYDPYRGMTIDDHFSAATATAVERWQKAHGQTRTGQVTLADLVFLPGAVRIGTQHAKPGDRVGPGAKLVDITGTTRIATVKLPADSDLAHAGDKVTVGLPDGTETPGVITRVGTTATSSSSSEEGGSGSGDDAKVAVTVRLTKPKATGGLDQAPVTVDFTRQRARNVLAVPVTALVTLSTGGYAVDVAGGGRVAVKTGMFATDGAGTGQVEISGPGISEGLRVVVPQ